MDRLKKILQTRWVAVMIFILLFYVITFAVYYFYSPGPAERKGLIGGTLEMVPDSTAQTGQQFPPANTSQ